MVCREGVFKTAVSAIKLAKSKGFCVMTNTTIFQGEDVNEFRQFFEFCKGIGVDGMMISPGYAYEKAPQQDIFLQREQTKSWFREALSGWREKKWPFNHSAFYLDFLEGRKDYDCTAWGIPLRNVFGWQKPCYLMAEEGYAKSYRELVETTQWSKFVTSQATRSARTAWFIPVTNRALWTTLLRIRGTRSNPRWDGEYSSRNKSGGSGTGSTIPFAQLSPRML